MKHVIKHYTVEMQYLHIHATQTSS